MDELPEVDKVYFPKSVVARGRYVKVLASVDDKVRILCHDPGQEDHTRTIRLSTFISRYERA